MKSHPILNIASAITDYANLVETCSHHQDDDLMYNRDTADFEMYDAAVSFVHVDWVDAFKTRLGMLFDTPLCSVPGCTELCAEAKKWGDRGFRERVFVIVNRNGFVLPDEIGSMPEFKEHSNENTYEFRIVLIDCQTNRFVSVVEDGYTRNHLESPQFRSSGGRTAYLKSCTHMFAIGHEGAHDIICTRINRGHNRIETIWPCEPADVGRFARSLKPGTKYIFKSCRGAGNCPMRITGAELKNGHVSVELRGCEHSNSHLWQTTREESSWAFEITAGNRFVDKTPNKSYTTAERVAPLFQQYLKDSGLANSRSYQNIGTHIETHDGLQMMKRRIGHILFSGYTRMMLYPYACHGPGKLFWRSAVVAIQVYHKQLVAKPGQDTEPRGVFLSPRKHLETAETVIGDLVESSNQQQDDMRKLQESSKSLEAENNITAVEVGILQKEVLKLSKSGEQQQNDMRKLQESNKSLVVENNTDRTRNAVEVGFIKNDVLKLSKSSNQQQDDMRKLQESNTALLAEVHSLKRSHALLIEHCNRLGALLGEKPFKHSKTNPKGHF